MGDFANSFANSSQLTVRSFNGYECFENLIDGIFIFIADTTSTWYKKTVLLCLWGTFGAMKLYIELLKSVLTLI